MNPVSMLLFLQDPSHVGKAVDRVFEISPDTVYGVLAGCLFLAVIYLAWRNEQKGKIIQDMLKDSVKGYSDINSILSSIKENDISNNRLIHDKLNELQRNVVDHLNFLREKIEQS